MSRPAVDWQADGDVVVYVGVAEDGRDARAGLAKDLAALGTRLDGAGIRDCVGQAAVNWAALWFLVDGFDDAVQRVRPLLDPAPAGLRAIMLAVASRLVWRDQEPPRAAAARGTAWSYIFTRNARKFMR